MRWSPRFYVFRRAGDIANCNLNGSEKMFHLVPATFLDLVIDIFHNPLEVRGQRLGRRFRAFEALHSFPQSADFVRYRRQCLGERIVDLFGIGDHDSFAVPKNNMSRNSYHS